MVFGDLEFCRWWWDLPLKLEALEPALYFATVSLTTLGFGDVILSQDVRLLSAIVAANGLVMFGLSTAFLLEFVGQVREEKGSSTRSHISTAE